MLSIWCSLLVMVVAAHAAAPATSSTSTKREDPSNPSGNSNGGGQPVYSPSASSTSYSSAAFDTSDAGGAYKAQQQSQGNLYYYYYPVQEKGQDNAYASSSTHNYATAPANGGSPYEGQDSSQTNYHASQASEAYASQDAAYANALNQLNQYGLGNGYSMGGGGLSASGMTGANAFGAYGASPTGYAASGMGGNGYVTGAGGMGSYPAGSAAVANYAPQASTLAQYAAQLTGYGGQQYGGQGALANSGYGVQGYGTPSRRYGLGSLIMPMLALAGLTMLVPTITSNLGSRNKRSTDAQPHPLTMISEYKDKLERYYSLYRTAVEKEECMNRIICEFGSAVSDVKGKGAVVLVLEKLIPKHMRPKMNVFKAGALSPEIGKCKKLFKC